MSAIMSASGATPFLLEGGQGIDLGTLAIILFVTLVVVLRLLMLRREHAMRTRCRSCGFVFDLPFGPGFRIGLWRYGRCPACGKASLLRTGIKAPLTGLAEEEKVRPPTEGEESDALGRQIRESKYD